MPAPRVVVQASLPAKLRRLVVRGSAAMRLWTVHPQYLDARGLVALWREALLAQKVLSGATRGYRHHPQLARFRATAVPTDAIATYLRGVLEEAKRRGYAFDASKILQSGRCGVVDATVGQLMYEWQHLKWKLRQRDPAQYQVCRSVSAPSPHPLFRIVDGGVEVWERRK